MKELLQNVWLAVHQYDATSRYEQTRGRFRAYLRQIITNCAIDILKARRKRTQEISLPNLPDIPDTAATANDMAAWREFIMEKAIEEVKDNSEDVTFICFELLTRRRLPAKEVAGILEISEDAVYQNAHRIRERVKEVAKQLGQDMEE